MRSLVLWSCLLLVVLLVVRGCEGNPQITPAAQKISILDLFKEDPSLKTKLEQSLTSKKSKTVETPARRHSRTEETPSSPVEEPKPSTTSTTTTTTTTETTTQSTTSAPTQNARRILRPQRLSARRSRPAAEKKKEVEPEASTVQEPTVTDEVANPEAEEAAPVEEEETPPVKPQNRFSILRANRRPLLPPFGKKPADTNTKKDETSGAATTGERKKFGGPRIRGNRNKPEEGVTSEPEPTTQGPRQRNARFNSRRRSKPTEEPEEPADEEAPTEPEFKPAGRLTIGGGRRRFSNARNPRQQISTTSEPTSVIEEDQTEEPRGSRFRNARVFPGSRRSSSSS